VEDLSLFIKKAGNLGTTMYRGPLFVKETGRLIEVMKYNFATREDLMTTLLKLLLNS